ncbi:MAG: cytochrome bc complex cytochrome b subunit [Acidobacteria bacterium]|nr:cytochrome bc complex cytochrome b subunit [Acidobacteriota bacterium]MBI3422610.1 cytochrome bc complex cytochrome b subunit [Acidobacteriota bacterium]
MNSQAQTTLTRTERLTQWLDERLGLAAIAKLAHKKEVPIHRHSIWYYFGGMTAFLIGVQAATGILLLLYYRPSAESAFESVQFIMTDVQFGWLIRSIHSWSANLLIATLFIHMFSVYFLKAYRAPRELTWVTGALLLFIMLGFGFSGYLLPWNKLAYFATKVGTDIAGVVPVVGHFLLRFLRGGDDVTGATLTRFYGFHIAVLPALTLALFGLHGLLVQKHGMSVPPSLEGKPLKTMKFVPNFLLRDLIGWILAVGVLAALAAFFPWELGEKADPFASAPAGIRPEWYFLFMFQTLKLIPAKIWIFDGEVIGIMAFSLGGLLLLLVPFLDRPSPQGKSKPAFTIIGILVVLFIVVMTVYGYLD